MTFGQLKIGNPPLKMIEPDDPSSKKPRKQLSCDNDDSLYMPKPLRVSKREVLALTAQNPDFARMTRARAKTTGDYKIESDESVHSDTQIEDDVDNEVAENEVAENEVVENGDVKEESLDKGSNQALNNHGFSQAAAVDDFRPAMSVGNGRDAFMTQAATPAYAYTVPTTQTQGSFNFENGYYGGFNYANPMVAQNSHAASFYQGPIQGMATNGSFMPTSFAADSNNGDYMSSGDDRHSLYCMPATRHYHYPTSSFINTGAPYYTHSAFSNGMGVGADMGFGMGYLPNQQISNPLPPKSNDEDKNPGEKSEHPNYFSDLQHFNN